MVDKQTPGRIVNVSSVARRRLRAERGAVHGDQGRAGGDDPHDGLRAGPPWHHRELRTPRCHQDQDERTHLHTDVVRSLVAKIPLGMIAPPEWVASAICYLASDEACYTTGACLDVDGGYAMDGSSARDGVR